MALRKSHENTSGVEGNYWRITQVQVVPKISVRVTASLYLSQEARAASKLPLMVKEFTWQEPASIEGSMVSYCYDMLKDMDFFSGSEDV